MRGRHDTARADRLQQQPEELRTRLAAVATPQDTIGDLGKPLDEMDKCGKQLVLRQKGGS